MKALVIRTGVRGTPLQLKQVPEPTQNEGALLVRLLALGICGTDREIVAGDYGSAPAGSDELILGHESLGEVLEAPPDCGFVKGDLVVGIVRRPDPVPCVNCGAQEWDMCRNGLYTERGIRGRNGFGSERFRLEPEFAIKVDAKLGELGVLVEPTSVVAKAWDHIERIGRRASFAPRRALVTGAGPIGILAALLGRQRGLEVHVVDRVDSGPKPEIVRGIGAIYHSSIDEVAREAKAYGRDYCGFDIAIECTGVGALIIEAMQIMAPDGILCLTGVSSGGRRIEMDVTRINRTLVLENTVVFGSVNANRRHYELAVRALAQADRTWLRSLITRRVPMSEWKDILRKDENDVKTILVP